MDSKIELLNEFYQTMRTQQLKLETKHYGFAFMHKLQSYGAVVDYVQLENHFIHKYRLLNVSEQLRNQLLIRHIQQQDNVCFYFDKTANNAVCFNLDSNYQKELPKNAAAVESAVQVLQQQLEQYGMRALAVRSGRGYHVWCRFEKPLANQLLLDFMIRISARTLATLHYLHYNYHAVKINMSPHPKYVDFLSLRAFGSRHIRTAFFSQIRTPDGRLLSEADSWQYFRYYLIHQTIAEQQFMQTYHELIKAIPL